jgi:hypothetical protein
MRGTLLYLTPQSLMICTIQRIWEQQLAAAAYSTSMVDYATEICLREDQQIRKDPRKLHVPEVLFFNCITRKISIEKANKIKR